MGDSLVKTKYPKFITLYFHSIPMLDHLPKNGLIPKGRYLSLRFFQDQIAKSTQSLTQTLKMCV